MKRIICIMTIVLNIFVSCSAQIKLNETEKQRAEETNVMHFFACMTSNGYYEKIAKNNYYIFDSIGEYLFYGKTHSGFFKGKITEIFKIDVDVLQKQMPNFRKLHGSILREIVLSDISEKNKIFNKSKIIIKNISYQLDDIILVSIDFEIQGQKQQKVYRLNTMDFGIID